MRFAWKAAAVLTLFALGAACRRAPAAPEARYRVRPLETPAAPGSGEPSLAAAPDGRVFLTWIEAAPDGVSTLRVAWRGEGGPWSTPTSVAQGPGFFVNWADFPSLLALADGTLVAHWLAKSAGHGYDVRIAVSRDAGATWSAPLTPHRDGTSSEHGFVSLVPWPGGGAGIVWLDGRDAAVAAPDDAAMRLMHTTLDGPGGLGAETLLDPRVCDCCQTAAAATDSGVIVAYRDRSPDEVRDIAVVRWEAGAWTEPTLVHADGWQMDGCPVNGPAVAARGRAAAVAWFTAANAPRVSLAFSGDGGRSFGAPIVVDDGRPVGRVDVALLPEGDALVSWIEQTPSGAELRVRTIGPQGARQPSLTVADSSTTRSSGFPRLELAGSEPVLAWRDAREPARVSSARLVRD